MQTYNEIQEIWKFHAYISFTDRKQMDENSYSYKINDMQDKINKLYKKMH